MYNEKYRGSGRWLSLGVLIWDNSCITSVRRRPGQNRVTWKTPSSRAFVPLQEPVGVLASYVPHAQMQVEAKRLWSYTTFISHRSRSWDKQAVET